jgi:hypothetical protein
MRLASMPTLSEMRGLVGDDLYVNFVWMWREHEQDIRAAERRTRLANVIPQAQTDSWPQPFFARVSNAPLPAAVPASTPSALPVFQSTERRTPRLGKGIDAGELARVLQRIGASTREAATAGRRSRR